MNIKTIIMRSLHLLSILLLCFSVPTLANDFSKQKRPYSLTISGGISLGVYEAGLNWVIIEMLRDGRLQGDQQARLLSITGASAGAINTLIAALRFCEKKAIPSKVDDNLFNATWRTMGIEDLLPDNESDYDHITGHPDGVLSRKKFKGLLNLLSEKARARIYRDDCHINLGLTVTRLVPEEKVISLGGDKEHIKVQRFVIPVTITTQNGYVIFRNNLNYAKRNRELGYLLLRQDASGYVPFDNILKSALASSAFPFAFGRIRLPYCRKSEVGGVTEKPDTETDRQASCPAGYQEYVYDFVDGGFFDNVPLGLAVELAECRPDKHEGCINEALSESEVLSNEVVNYIYMEPSKRRKTFEMNLEREDELSDGFGIYNQGKFWFKAQEVYANAELYRALREKFDRSDPENEIRRLLLTNRYPPIGGAYLAHFGAFFGQVFRDFDYHVGVYDGMVNFASHCITEGKKIRSMKIPLSEIDSDCHKLGAMPLKNVKNPHYQLERKTGIIVERVTKRLLEKEDHVARLMIRMLAEDEFTTYQSEGVRYPEWQWLDSLPDYKTAEGKHTFHYDLYHLFQSDDAEDFSKIIVGLKKIRKEFPTYFESDPVKGSNKKLSQMINKPDSWKFTLGRKVSSRLYTLEKQDKDNSFALIPIKLSSMALNSYDSRQNNNIWAISSIDPKGWQYLIPDEVALDGSQTGLVFTYRKAMYRFKDSSAYLEGEYTPLHWVRKRDDRTFFTSIGLNLRYARKSPLFSSFGTGLKVYKNYGQKAGLQNDPIPGIGLDIGLFADKYRITVEYKFIDNQFDDERWLLKFGINDFKGISDLLFGD